MLRHVIALCIASFSTALIAQVPPPPPLPMQKDVAIAIKRSLESKDTKLYESLLAPDVHVYEDVKLIATTREQWMKRFAPKLKAIGVSFKVKQALLSTGRITLIQSFDSTGSWGGLRMDCCQSVDVSTYMIEDGKIRAIYNLSGGEELAL